MATVDLAGGAQVGRTAAPGIIFAEKVIDFAAAATAKGSALAAADVIECIDIPAESLVLNAGFEVVTAAGGESADNAWDLGITGVDADVFVDGFDGDAAAAGAYAQNAAAYQPVVVTTADTIDLLIQAATTAPTSGSIRVWAVYMPIGGRTLADEVDRDQLA